MNFLEKLAKLEIIILIVGLIITGWFSWQSNIQTKESLEITKKLAQNQIFVEYTKKYKEIDLPKMVTLDNNITKLDQISIKNIKLYYDLIAQEEYLYRHELISSELWTLWGNGIKPYLKTFWFKKIWKEIHNNGYYSDEFKNFVNNI